MNTSNNLPPVTALSGSLGAGKTTLRNREGPNDAACRQPKRWPPVHVTLREARICDRQAGELEAADVQRVSAACGEARKP